MANYTIDAALPIAVSNTLPATFPYYFGPSATATKSTPARVNISLPVTATMTATMSKHASIDAVPLIINAGSTHPGSFPVQFPRPFPYNSIGAPPQATMNMEAAISTATAATVGFATISSKHVFADAPLAVGAEINTGTGYPTAVSASLVVTAARTATMKHNAIAVAEQSVTAAFSAKVKAAWHPGATMAVTVAQAAKTAHHAFIGASLSTVAARTAAVKYSANINAAVAGRATTAAAMGLHGKMSAPMPVTVARNTIVGKHYFIQASLGISIYANFPYTFPFIFEQSFDTISRGQSLTAALPVAASAAASIALGHTMHAAVPITASFNVLMLQGHEQAIAASLAVTAARTAAMTRGRSIAASQTITAASSGAMHQFAEIAASLQAEMESNVLANYRGRADAGLDVSAVPQVVTNMLAFIAAAMPVEFTIFSTSGIEWSADSELNTQANIQTTVGHGSTMGATLAIRAIMNVTSPTATGFWPFFLK